MVAINNCVKLPGELKTEGAKFIKKNGNKYAIKYNRGGNIACSEIYVQASDSAPLNSVYRLIGRRISRAAKRSGNTIERNHLTTQIMDGKPQESVLKKIQRVFLGKGEPILVNTLTGTAKGPFASPEKALKFSNFTKESRLIGVNAPESEIKALNHFSNLSFDEGSKKLIGAGEISF